MTQSTEVRSELGSLPRRESGSEDIDNQEVGKALRRFVRGGDRGDDGLERVSDGWLPALLHRYREESQVRTPFPFFLPESSTESGSGGEPLASLLRRSLDGLEIEAGDARVLADNLDRFERAIRLELGETGKRTGFRGIAEAVLPKATQGLSDHVKGSLERVWGTLVAAVPPGDLLPFGADVPLEMWIQAAELRAYATRGKLVAELTELRRKARERLTLETADESTSVGGLGAGADLVDPAALAQVSKKRAGRISLDPQRRDALRRSIEVIEGFLDGAASPSLLIVETGESRSDAVRRDSGAPALDGNATAADAAAARAAASGSTERGPGSSVWVFSDPDPSSRALELFLREADAWTEIVQAIRRCELEVDGTFDPVRHDPILSAITRESLTGDELSLLPPVVAVENVVRLRGRGLSAVSRVLRSGWPVHVLVTLDPFDDTEPDRYRLELGYVGMGHRRAAIHQGVASEPADLLRAYELLAGRLEPSLHIIGVAKSEAAPGPWLHLGAAVEGRAHPVFVYDPKTGRSWAERFDFSGNPETELDWPVYPFRYQNSGDADDAENSLDLAFTFADFAILDPTAWGHFRVVPEGFDHEDLVPVSEAIENDDLSHTPRIPYIWAVDAEGRLVRLATTEAMLRGARDRLDYWRTLQELAGVRNAYVQSAVARVESTAKEAAEAARRELEEKFGKELDEARESAVKEALGGVARFLLGMGDSPGAWIGGDSGDGAPGTNALPPAAPAGAGTGAGTAPPPAEETQAGVAPAAPAAPATPDAPPEEEDPWIDSPLCTSCNDCIQINPRVFVYDENKQARIGDPEAGTYAEIVKAAEKCPSRCIHPGTPLDPDEPGLTELLARAKAFR